MMTLPQRTSSPSPGGDKKTNVIELNTIKVMPRRSPYIFPVETPPGTERPKPYVFPEERQDASVEDAPKVRLFDFLASGRATEKASDQSLPDPWGSLTESLEQTEDPEAVSEMLAELLSKLDDLAARRKQRLQRIVPRGAIALPPLAIAASLLVGNYALSSVEQAIGLASLTPLTPWIAGILAVPAGLRLASLLLGLSFRQVKPGDRIRMGTLRGSIQAANSQAWRVDVDGMGPRLVPYYLALYADTERLCEDGPQA